MTIFEDFGDVDAQGVQSDAGVVFETFQGFLKEFTVVAVLG